MTGILPTTWKQTAIIPIPKPGRPDEYRPISLTSCLSKTLKEFSLLLYFQKGKGTQMSLAQYLTGSHVVFLFHRFQGSIRELPLLQSSMN